MTERELNNEIRGLFKYFKNISELDPGTYFDKEPFLKKELKRLYYVDTTFESLNVKSVKRLLKMNLRLRVVPLHQFGIHIEID